jgi:hypothetical protein
MPYAASDQRSDRNALAREARHLAEEVESLYIRLQQAGALAKIRQYMLAHPEEVPRLDLVQTARALRCYADVLFLTSGAAKCANHSGPSNDL